MRTYKQFVIESNTAKDNLYEGWGAVWTGAKLLSRAVGAGLAYKAYTDRDEKGNLLRDKQPIKTLVRGGAAALGAVSPGPISVVSAITNTLNTTSPTPKNLKDVDPPSEESKDKKKDPKIGDRLTDKTRCLSDYRYDKSTNTCVKK